MHTRIILLIVGLGFIFSSGYGQLSKGGKPYSFSASINQIKSSVPFIEFNCVIPVELKSAENKDGVHLKNLHFAEPIATNITPENSGAWEDIPGDKRLWRVGIRSWGAYSLNLIFGKYKLPKGAKLFIYTPDRSTILGAFTSENNRQDQVFSTVPLPGDAIILEYEEPKSVSSERILQIRTVNHDFKGTFADAGRRPLGLAQSCNREVNCPEGQPWKKQRNAVCRILIAGTDLCTATLLNNTGNDKSPMIITAWHCLTKAENASTTICLFNYENPICGTLDGDVSHTISGAKYLAGSDSLDFALMELSTPPPASFQPYYAGWDRSIIAPDSVVCIHHPNADNKKLVSDHSAPQIGTYPGFVKNNFWNIVRWQNGTTEGGSSGSPLFSTNQLFVGTLTGGSSTCDSPVNDFFSKINGNWEHYSASDSQLKNWLDPMNSNVQKLEGYDPYPSSTACNAFVNVNADEKAVVQKVTNGKGYWSGNNSLGYTEVAEKFTNSESCTISEVGLMVAKSSSPTATGKITVKIYEGKDLPETLMGQKDVPMTNLVKNAMNFVTFPSPISIHGNYFISCKFSYSTASDTFALYHAQPRGIGKLNTSYCRLGNSWFMLPEKAGRDFTTSLLIQSMPCDVVAAEIGDTVQVQP
ncbi:MAG: trypsin-like peptidase domain-containing protein, partial [Bacteroidota bacterium]|nr:trypsin-like peptidase domain-containing protein [Bacteroidota bacterium]